MSFSSETYALLKSQGGGGGSGLPSVTEADNGKVLSVVDGAWAASVEPFIVEQNIEDGSLSKTFNEIKAAYDARKTIFLHTTVIEEQGLVESRYVEYLNAIILEYPDVFVVRFGPTSFEASSGDSYPIFVEE